MNVTEKLARIATRRVLSLERFKASEARRINSMMGKLQDSLLNALDRHNPADLVRTAFQNQRLDNLFALSQSRVKQGYLEIASTAKTQLSEVARLESLFFQASVETTVGVDIVSGQLSATTIRSLASDTLIQGAPSKEWWMRQANSMQTRFMDSMRQGVLRGETVTDLAARVRGTKAAGYSDGIMEASKNQAEALVRTSVQTVSNEARNATYEENQDLIKGLQWVATLDLRTTEICMALSGKVWSLPDYEPIGHETEYPGPTAHWGCRSTQVAVFKSWKELSSGRTVTTKAGGKTDLDTAFRKNLAEMGMSQDQIDKAVLGARASMDGQVSKELTFEDWLKDKTVAQQNEALGPGRAELWRNGDITLSDLIDQKGRPLSLEQLSKVPKE